MPIDLERYALFADQTIEEFRLLDNQGYCNDNYIAKLPDRSYFVRLLKLPNLDRHFEFRVQQKAHRKGLAPKPLLLDLEQRLMITEFVTGEHQFILNKKQLRRLASILKKLHTIKLRKRPHNHKKDFKFRHKKAQAVLVKLKKYQRDLVICHHDLNPKNIFFHEKIAVVDWEFAGVNDRYFDLATICVEFKLSRKLEQYFLRNYFTLVSRNAYKKLALYKTLYQELYRVWMGEKQ